MNQALIKSSDSTPYSLWLNGQLHRMHWKKSFAALAAQGESWVYCMRKQRKIPVLFSLVFFLRTKPVTISMLLITLASLTASDGSDDAFFPWLKVISQGLDQNVAQAFFLQNLCFSAKGSSPRVPFLNPNLSGEHLPHFLGRITICDSLCPGAILCTKDCEKYQAGTQISPQQFKPTINSPKTVVINLHRILFTWICQGKKLK